MEPFNILFPKTNSTKTCNHPTRFYNQETVSTIPNPDTWLDTRSFSWNDTGYFDRNQLKYQQSEMVILLLSGRLETIIALKSSSRYFFSSPIAMITYSEINARSTTDTTIASNASSTNIQSRLNVRSISCIDNLVIYSAWHQPEILLLHWLGGNWKYL